MSFFKGLVVFVLCLVSRVVLAVDYSLMETMDGIEYGFYKGKSDSLVVVISTDIDESMRGVYSSTSNDLKAKGYSVASIDATCHGKDVERLKASGLDCWRERVDSSKADIFEPFISALRSVISDIDHGQLSNVVVLGVSRGGYLALRAAAEIDQIDTVIALAPVTDIFALREFDGFVGREDQYSLHKYSSVLASKNVFIQINNNDQRVNTDAALSLVGAVVESRPAETTNLTLILTPKFGHSTSEHERAASWAMEQSSGTCNGCGTLEAP